LDGIINVQGKLKCPLDRIPFPPECQNPQSFQINTEILAKLEEALAGVCEKHEKKNSLVCFTDKVMVCEDCIVENEAHHSHKAIPIKEVRKMVEEKIEYLQKQLADFKNYKEQQCKELESKKEEAVKEIRKVAENLKEAVQRKDREIYFELSLCAAAKKLIEEAQKDNSLEANQKVVNNKANLSAYEAQINEVLKGYYNTFLPMGNQYNLNFLHQPGCNKLETRVQVFQKKFSCEITLNTNGQTPSLVLNFGSSNPKAHNALSLSRIHEVDSVVFTCAGTSELLDKSYTMKDLGNLWSYLNLEESLPGQIKSFKLDFQNKSPSHLADWVHLMNQGLFKLSNLKTLDIKCPSKLTGSNLDSFSQNILPKLTSLEDFWINLKDTQITDKSLQNFFGNMREPMKNLKTLSLILWDMAITDEGILPFAKEALPYLSSLQSFTFGLEDIKAGEMKLTDKSIEPLFLALKNVASELRIVNIGLSGSEITQKSFDVFVKEIFPLMTKLEDLKLGLRKTLIEKDVIDGFSAGLTMANKVYSS